MYSLNQFQEIKKKLRYFYNAYIAHACALVFIITSKSIEVIASDAKRARSRKLISTVIYGMLNSAIYQELLVFEALGMEQKMFVYDHSLEFCD